MQVAGGHGSTRPESTTGGLGQSEWNVATCGIHFPTYTIAGKSSNTHFPWSEFTNTATAAVAETAPAITASSRRQRRGALRLDDIFTLRHLSSNYELVHNR
jgi:hypothetical protein